MVGFLRFEGTRRRLSGKPKPLLITAIFFRAASGRRAIEGIEREASDVKTKRPAPSINPG